MRRCSVLLIFAAVLALSISLAAQNAPVVLPTGLTFGYIPTGTAVVQTVSAYNVGKTSVILNSITPSLGEFTVVSGTFPVTILAGKRADFSIQFKPDAARSFAGHLTFAFSKLANQNANVTGYGTNTTAIPSLSTTSMTFSNQPLGTVSPAQTLTITNTGTTAFSVTNVVVTYPFSQTGWTKSISISPGNSLNLAITYVPTLVASQPGTISMTYNIAPPNGISLWGTGVSATAMGISTYPTLPSATQGYAYQATLNATGGTAPYIWGLASGSNLPSGLSLSSAGIISGTLASGVATGSYSFTVQATDSSSTPITASSLLTVPVASHTGYDNCNNVSVNASDGSGPIIPISDLGTNYYLGIEEGGLYANGSNLDDPSHDSYGQSAARAIQPLDASGNPDPNGKYVFVSVGLSLAQQPFGEFVQLVNTDPAKNSNLVIVNGGTGGATASLLAGNSSQFWGATLYDYLPNAGVTAKQVVAAWVLDVNGGPTGTFPSDMTNLQSNLQSIAQLLLTYFPNIKLAYYSSPNYTGYSDGAANLDPEPYAYETGMAVKNAIEDQISGDPSMNFNPADGPVYAPWIAWGPYYWANGMIPRSDGLVWTCQDLDADGTHPSNPVGRIKVSTQLLNFLKTDDTASIWFLAPGSSRRLR